MKIAVLLGGVGSDNQKRTINGILDSAIPAGTDVYIFTCEAWRYGSFYKYEKGEYNIYQLPDFTQYDGVIINPVTIHDKKIVEEVTAKIEKAGVPCVSLNVKWNDAMCVLLENRLGIQAIAEHLVQVHGVKNIYYISGPLHNKDARERLSAYKDAMEKCHLEWNEQTIVYGDFTYQSGMKVVKQLLQEGRALPDAIMVCNDGMAIGAVLALQELGYRIPEDIIVTGYDDSSMAKMNSPRLTTVERGEYEAGEMAYKMLIQEIRKENPAKEYTVYGKAVFSQSCGCEEKVSFSHAQLKKMYIRKSVEVDDDLELLKCCGAEFTGVETFEDFTKCVQRYIKQMDPDYFYLCMCGSIENYYAELERMAEGQERGRDVTVYKEDIYVPIAYEKGEFSSYGEFHKNALLPPFCKKKEEGGFYLVMPMHHQEYCFGYCVVGNYKPALDNHFFRHFILGLDNALEMVRKQDTMKAMLGRLNRMWLYDELTGVYNRAGLHKFAPEILVEAKSKKMPLAVIFADLDGLKRVNDNYGHKEGDSYIKALADILERSCRHEDLLVRYGGDEFIIMVSGCFEEDIKKYVEKIYEFIGRYNHLYPKECILDASVGYWVEQNLENVSLEKIIQLADQNMYQSKRAKKAAGMLP